MSLFRLNPSTGNHPTSNIVLKFFFIKRRIREISIKKQKNSLLTKTQWHKHRVHVWKMIQDEEGGNIIKFLDTPVFGFVLIYSCCFGFGFDTVVEKYFLFVINVLNFRYWNSKRFKIWRKYFYFVLPCVCVCVTKLFCFWEGWRRNFYDWYDQTQTE